MKGLMVSVMANVTNEANTANMAASSNVAAGNAVDANNHSDNHSNKRNNVQNNKGAKIANASASSTSSTNPTESLIITPPSTWPAWMQKAMVDNGRVAFRGSKIGIKIGTTLHSKHCSLKKMLKIIKKYQKRLYPDQKPSNFRRKPTPSYLRKHCTCIAFYRAEEGSRADCDFSIILYDNGWFEYWGTGRRTTLYLPDCKEFIYKYNLAIDEIDKTTVDQSVLENTTWYTVATLFAEERITQNMVGYGANAPCDNSEGETGARTGVKARAGVEDGFEAGEEQPISESKKVTEIVGAAHIPTPEERLLKQERQNEMRRIINDTVPTLSEKQSEVYHALFEEELSRGQACEKLNLQESALRSRIMKLRVKFGNQIKNLTGEEVEEYLDFSRSTKERTQDTHEGQKDHQGQQSQSDVAADENFEDENDFEDEAE